MKLGCTVSTYETKFGPIVFRDGNLADNFRLMEACGYQGVDLFIRESTEEQIAEYYRMLKEYGLSVTTLFAIYLGECGVSLSETDINIRRRNIDLVKRQLDYAVKIQAKGLGMGFIRGGHQRQESEEEALKRIAEALSEIGEYAMEIGTTVMLEPINRYEINTLNRGTDAADFIRNRGLKGISLLLDMFHMNIEESSISGTVYYAGSLIQNVHVSSSNRYAVGEGHLDYLPVMRALHEIGYEGCLTLEAFASEPEISLRKTAEYLKCYL